jgi:hypothetical protein
MADPMVARSRWQHLRAENRSSMGSARHRRPQKRIPNFAAGDWEAMKHTDRRFHGWLFAALAGAVALALLGILVFNAGGWGTLVLDLALSFGAHLLMAMALLSLLLLSLRALSRERLDSILSRTTLTLVFLVIAVAVLPLVPLLFGRSLDVYDALQTIVMAAAFFLLVEPVTALLGAASRGSSAGRARSRTLRALRYGRTERKLRRELMSKVLGDEATADRLVAYERRRAPGASLEEHLKRALGRLGRDRR